MSIAIKIDTELGRFYQDVDGTDYVGVTTCLEVAVSKKLQKYFKKYSENSQAKKLDYASSEGTALHEMIQDDIRGLNPVVTEPNRVKVLEQWKVLQEKEKIVVDPKDIELQVISKKYGYAGTLDMIGTHKGTRCIMDIKTGSFTVKAGWQMALYRMAWHEMTGELLPCVGLSIHRDGTQEAKVFVYQHYDFTERMGLACLEIFKGLYFTKLKEMNWTYLTKNSLEQYSKEVIK